MILMWILVFAVTAVVMVLSVAMVVLSQVLTAAAIIFAVLNFLIMLAIVIVLIVLTKKGKFKRDYLQKLKESSHGIWKYWAMRILQVALWVFAVWSFIVMALCILCAVIKPLDSLVEFTAEVSCTAVYSGTDSLSK